MGYSEKGLLNWLKISYRHQSSSYTISSLSSWLLPLHWHYVHIYWLNSAKKVVWKHWKNCFCVLFYHCVEGYESNLLKNGLQCYRRCRIQFSGCEQVTPLQSQQYYGDSIDCSLKPFGVSTYLRLVVVSQHVLKPCHLFRKFSILLHANEMISFSFPRCSQEHTLSSLYNCCYFSFWSVPIRWRSKW